MAGPKDYYKVLGVPETASADELKKSYRKLAKKFHPDVTGGDKAKTARFKEITEAYETLGDEKKRAAYDEARKNPFANMPGAGPGGAGFGGGFSGGAAGFDLNEILNRMRGEVNRERASRGRAQAQRDPRGGGFGDMFEAFGFGGGGRAQPDRGEDAIAQLEIDLPEAALGAEKLLQIEGKRLTVKIPPGVTTGKTIRVAGQGHASPGGAPNGDLLIEIKERPHPQFRRVIATHPGLRPGAQPGSPDIEIDVPIPLDVAVLGGKAEVPALEGTTVTVTIPPGTSSGRRLRLRGKGAHATKDQRGDLYAVVQVQVPSGELPPGAKELIAEFARLTRK